MKMNSRKTISRHWVLILTLMLFYGFTPVKTASAQDFPSPGNGVHNPVRTEQMLSSILRSAPSGIGVVENRVFTSVNDYILQLTGYSREELMGESARMVYPSDEEYEFVGRTKYRQISQSGTGSVETRWKRKDGRLLHVILSSMPLDPDNLDAGVVFTVLDITDRKETAQALEKRTRWFLMAMGAFLILQLLWILVLTRNLRQKRKMEEKLRQSEHKYRQLFDNAPSGMYEIDFLKNTFSQVNEAMCRYTGYSREAFLSMNPLNLLTAGSRNQFLIRMDKLKAGETIPGNVEYDILTKAGKTICVIVNSDFIYNNGKLTGARVVAHDISELKQAQAEKINAQKMAGEQKKLALVGQIAGKLAHDFNNVLGVIMGTAELSLLDCKDDDARESLKLIVDQTIRGKNLTKNLVAFAKSEEPRQEVFSITSTIALVLTLLKKDLQGVELVREDEENLPDLLADPGMMEHALVNLIQNSIHAIGKADHPRIIIRTHGLGDHLYLEIEDNGCGIPQAYLGQIFDPSFTLKGGRDVFGAYASDIKGTGYGLSNVKKYIEQHKGTIRVDSTPGKGTRFTISLPVIQRQLTKKEKIDILNEKIYSDLNVLLVEDEPAISDIQYRVLTQEPFRHRVDIAQNGPMAMDLFEKKPYDFISLDYRLPGKMNGMDVYLHIRKKHKTIPILFVSGNIEFLESMNELKKKDACLDHLSKPCLNREYVKRINALISRAGASCGPAE